MRNFRYSQKIQKLEEEDAFSERSCDCHSCGGELKKTLSKPKLLKLDLDSSGSMLNSAQMRPSTKLSPFISQQMLRRSFRIIEDMIRKSSRELAIPQLEGPTREKRGLTIFRTSVRKITTQSIVLKTFKSRKTILMPQDMLPVQRATLSVIDSRASPIKPINAENMKIQLPERVQTEPDQKNKKLNRFQAYYFNFPTQRQPIRSLNITPIPVISKQILIPQIQQKYDKNRSLSHRLQCTYLKHLKPKN